jgi:hypothetical protein
MKRIATLFLTLALPAALAAAPSAQNAPVPNITSVPSRDAFDTNRVVLFGTNLGLVTEVKVNGTSYPIIRATPGRLVVGPVPPQTPGFGTVEALGSGSADSATIEFTPTLKASRRGMRLTATVNNGDVGSYILRFNYQRLPTLEVDEGIYYGRLIPLASPVLSTGVFGDGSPVTVSTLIPVQVGLIGAPLNVQAQCSVGVAGVQSYTNLAEVAGFAHQ